VMGGCFIEDGPAVEYNFKLSPKLTARLYTEWPAAIDTIPWEVGAQAVTGKELIDKQGYSSPVTIAYLLHSGYRTGRPSWDPTTALAAARATVPGLEWSEPGILRIGPRGESVFTPEPDGMHRVASLTSGEELGAAVDALLYAPVA